MANFFVHSTAVVDEGAQIGEGSRIWHFAHIRSGAIIGTMVIIGKSSYIDSNVQIGNNCKIQNLVSIYNGVTIEDDVFVGPHVTFTNDLFPRATGDWQIIPTHVERGASVGANSTIICGITIGSFSLVAAGSVVTKNIPTQALVAGNPARIIGWVCICARKLNIPADFSGSQSVVCKYCGMGNELSLD